jgi:hypothetical protein
LLVARLARAAELPPATVSALLDELTAELALQAAELGYCHIPGIARITVHAPAPGRKRHRIRCRAVTASFRRLIDLTRSRRNDR